MEVLKLFVRTLGFQRLKLRLLSMGLKIETLVNFDPRTDLVDWDTSNE